MGLASIVVFVICCNASTCFDRLVYLLRVWFDAADCSFCLALAWYAFSLADICRVWESSSSIWSVTLSFGMVIPSGIEVVAFSVWLVESDFRGGVFGLY